MVHTFQERFLRFQLLFLDFYHFHHVIWAMKWAMKWAKKLKTKMDKICRPGPFRMTWPRSHCENFALLMTNLQLQIEGKNS